VDQLRTAVKKARAVANTVEVIDTKIGKKLFKFIEGDTFE
jgi:hypothetical protein